MHVSLVFAHLIFGFIDKKSSVPRLLGEQELPTLPEHMSLSLAFSVVRAYCKFFWDPLSFGDWFILRRFTAIIYYPLNIFKLVLPIGNLNGYNIMKRVPENV